MTSTSLTYESLPSIFLLSLCLPLFSLAVVIIGFMSSFIYLIIYLIGSSNEIGHVRKIGKTISALPVHLDVGQYLGESDEEEELKSRLDLNAKIKNYVPGSSYLLTFRKRTLILLASWVIRLNYCIRVKDKFVERKPLLNIISISSILIVYILRLTDDLLTCSRPGVMCTNLYLKILWFFTHYTQVTVGLVKCMFVAYTKSYTSSLSSFKRFM